MKIVADESVDFGIIEALRGEGIEVVAIVEAKPSISDDEVLDEANILKSLLLTEDKDFGELIVRLRKPHHGVLLVRLGGFDLAFKIGLVKKALIGNFPALLNHFSVLDERRLRIRKVI